MKPRFVIRTPARSLTVPPFGYSVLVRAINDDDSFGQMVEVQVDELSFVKAGLDSSAFSDRMWSALLVGLRTRIDLQLALDDDPNMLSVVSTTSSDLKAAVALAAEERELPDLTLENAAF